MEPDTTVRRSPGEIATDCVKIAREIEGMAKPKDDRQPRRGDLAALRRVGRPGHEVPPEAFWSLMEKYAIPQKEEQFWLVVVPLMTAVPHASTPPGEVFVNAKISPARLERWLNQDCDAARRDVRLLLKRVDGGLHWGRLGRLLCDWSESDRRSLARDYYRARYSKTQESTPTDGAGT